MVRSPDELLFNMTIISQTKDRPRGEATTYTSSRTRQIELQQALAIQL
ncbi:hypothetical protein M3J09_011255 [Ascochyta lentis]